MLFMAESGHCSMWGCITCDINKFINLDVLEKSNFNLKCFQKNLQHKSLLLPILAGLGQGTGRTGDLRARKGTALGAGSPGHVMKQDKLSFTCKE